jgi:hypothetical protein
MPQQTTPQLHNCYSTVKPHDLRNMLRYLILIIFLQELLSLYMAHSLILHRHPFTCSTVYLRRFSLHRTRHRLPMVKGFTNPRRFPMESTISPYMLPTILEAIILTISSSQPLQTTFHLPKVVRHPQSSSMIRIVLSVIALGRK